MRRGSNKFHQSIYQPQNPEKYMGSGKIHLRSSWELAFATFLDTNEHILEWASEPFRIPYKNVMGKNTTYVPDFIIRYRTKDDVIKTELIEIKPHNQSVIKEGQNSNQRMVVANNMLKWVAARAFCKAQGIKFVVLTEHDIFAQTGKK